MSFVSSAPCHNGNDDVFASQQGTTIHCSEEHPTNNTVSEKKEVSAQTISYPLLLGSDNENDTLEDIQNELDIWPCGHERRGHDPSKKQRRSGQVLSAVGSNKSWDAKTVHRDP